MALRYVPNILYAMGLTSVSIHLLDTRKQMAEERAIYRAQESVLSSLISRLRAGEDISDTEIERLKTLAYRRTLDSRLGTDEQKEEIRMGWKETLLGRVRKDVGRDDERVEKEIEACESRTSYVNL
jgi:hypothetical protein